MIAFTASTRFRHLLCSRARRKNLCLVEAVHPGTTPPPPNLRWEGEWQRCEQRKKEAIFRSVLLEYIHISCANTFGMGELTAAIAEIPDILPKTHQLQIIVIFYFFYFFWGGGEEDNK